MQDFFSTIYSENRWSNGSGPGSNPNATKEYRAYLQQFLKTYQIKSVVDAGCGDWQFSSLINWDSIDYLGLDIVPAVVEKNTKHFGQENIRFKHCNIAKENLPPADLLILKDVIQHWTNEEILAFLPQFKKYKYVLVTNDVEQENGTFMQGINTEGFTDERTRYKPVDITQPPFNVFALPVLVFQVGVYKYTYFVDNSRTQIRDSIPNIFHFNFGMAEDMGEKPFSFIHYMGIKSCYEVNKPDVIYFHYRYEPSGDWWEKTKPYIKPVLVDAPSIILGRPIKHVAHKSDVIRLRTLRKAGGVYFDCDTICIKPVSDLYENLVVLGRENNGGIGNAAMLSRVDSFFLNEWYIRYNTFDCNKWLDHSCWLARELHKIFRNTLTLLDTKAFYGVKWEDFDSYFHGEGTSHVTNSYSHHLCEVAKWDFLKTVTPEMVRNGKSEFLRLLQRFL